jgi:hypothetical protein
MFSASMPSTFLDKMPALKPEPATAKPDPEDPGVTCEPPTPIVTEAHTGADPIRLEDTSWQPWFAGIARGYRSLYRSSTTCKESAQFHIDTTTLLHQ